MSQRPGFALGISAGLGDPMGTVVLPSRGLARPDSVVREADVTMSHSPEDDWTLSLRKRPRSALDRRPDGGRAEEYELLCRDCGDDPRGAYRGVPAELQQVRGPYSLEAGIEAFMEHNDCHEPVAEQPTRSG